MAWVPSDETEQCVRYNTANFPYEELSCLYSSSFGQTYTQLELNYNPVPLRDWMTEHPWVPVMACVLYGAWCYGGRAYFANREPWNFRTTMALWNLFLSVFSAIGFLRTFPHLVHLLTHYKFLDNLCNDPESHYGSGTTGLWIQMFVLSKFPELFDTFFIVVHKKKLLFLHWYHHISVLLYCWHSYVTKAPAGLVFCVMNYGVHAIMYFYYYLMAIKRKPKWLNAMIITIAQISQMVVGVATTMMGFFMVPSDRACWIGRDNNIAAFIMYGSYLILFLEFFFTRYYVAASTTTTKKKVTKQA